MVPSVLGSEAGRQKIPRHERIRSCHLRAVTANEVVYIPAILWYHCRSCDAGQPCKFGPVWSWSIFLSTDGNVDPSKVPVYPHHQSFLRDACRCWRQRRSSRGIWRRRSDGIQWNSDQATHAMVESPCQKRPSGCGVKAGALGSS